MAMSKGKMAASVAGGVFLVAAAALGYMLYDAYSTRMEAEAALESAKSTFDGHYSAAVFPSEKSIESVKSNEKEYAGWLNVARSIAARGDKSFADESPAAFKQRLQDEARRLRALPGGVDGNLVAQGFMFGFDKYLDPEHGVLPDKADVHRLAIQLDTVSRLAEMFSRNNAVELREVTCVAPPKDDGEEGRRPRRGSKKKKASAADEGTQATSLDYRVSVIVRPSAFVDILNALTADVRFTVVKSFAFHETADMIVDKMNAAEAALAKKDAPSSGRHRRRRVLQEEQPAEEAAGKKDDRMIVDPELDAPVQMDLTLSVYDFGGVAQKTAEADEKTPGKEAK